MIHQNISLLAFLATNGFAVWIGWLALTDVQKAYKLNTTRWQIAVMAVSLTWKRRRAWSRLPWHEHYREKYSRAEERSKYKANSALVVDTVYVCLALLICFLGSISFLIADKVDNGQFDISLLNSLYGHAHVRAFPIALFAVSAADVLLPLLLLKIRRDAKVYKGESFDQRVLRWESSLDFLNRSGDGKASRDPSEGLRALSSPNAQEAIDVNAIRKLLHRRAEEVSRSGEKLYRRLRSKLEPRHSGEYVIINVATEQYVLGDTLTQANQKYKASYGDAPAWGTRIGVSIFAELD